MKTLNTVLKVGLGALGLAGLFIPTLGHAAEESPGDVTGLITRGEASYQSYCASCHGPDGEGEGILTEYLTVKPSDLTAIAPGLDGEFPFDRIYQVIDGRGVPVHGGREMPVWGPAFMGMDETHDKKAVKEKIVELVYYLKSIQSPAE